MFCLLSIQFLFHRRYKINEWILIHRYLILFSLFHLYLSSLRIVVDKCKHDCNLELLTIYKTIFDLFKCTHSAKHTFDAFRLLRKFLSDDSTLKLVAFTRALCVGTSLFI